MSAPATPSPSKSSGVMNQNVYRYSQRHPNNNNTVKSDLNSSFDCSPVESRRRHYSGSVRRPPSILNGIRELVIRQRSESFGAQTKKPTLFRKVQVTGCALSSVYDLREGEEDESDIYDDEVSFRRPRSNSSDLLILRKTSRPLSVDVVGLVDAQSDPYRQYMKVIDCYELAPNAGNVVVIDRNLKVGKAFIALCENNVGAGLVWDSELNKVVSIVTLTDFLVYLQTSNPSESADLDCILNTSQLVTVPSTTKVFDACSEFCANLVHRIVVTEPGTGDVLYLLTIKRVLQAIHKQNRSLHFAQWLMCTIRESKVGKWDDTIYSVSVSDSLDVAVQLMLGFRISSLPVLDTDGKALDVLYKSDIARALRGRKDAKKFFAECTVGHALAPCRPAAFYALEDDPVSKVLDALLSSRHCRCTFVLDSEGKLVGSISLSDVLRHLLFDRNPFIRSPVVSQPSSDPASSSSTSIDCSS